MAVSPADIVRIDIKDRVSVPRDVFKESTSMGHRGSKLIGLIPGINTSE